MVLLFINICSGYENLAKFNVDGTNFFETHLAFKKAIDRARKGLGPSVIVSKGSSSTYLTHHQMIKENTEQKKN